MPRKNNNEKDKETAGPSKSDDDTTNETKKVKAVTSEMRYDLKL